MPIGAAFLDIQLRVLLVSSKSPQSLKKNDFGKLGNSTNLHLISNLESKVVWVKVDLVEKYE